ncbi:hypothetical protein K438DRAFT_2041508 [Mycena galopus ATCC 62051]|nr:hypothetical protein K438DRAFT_2041508 [Mycena galopus ATCC 62051]
MGKKFEGTLAMTWPASNGIPACVHLYEGDGISDVKAGAELPYRVMLMVLLERLGAQGLSFPQNKTKQTLVVGYMGADVEWTSSKYEARNRGTPDWVRATCVNAGTTSINTAHDLTPNRTGTQHRAPGWNAGADLPQPSHAEAILNRDLPFLNIERARFSRSVNKCSRAAILVGIFEGIGNEKVWTRARISIRDEKLEEFKKRKLLTHLVPHRAGPAQTPAVK